MLNKQMRKIVNVLLIIALVLSNLTFTRYNPLVSQYSLRAKATYQTGSTSQDLQESLILSKGPASMAAETHLDTKSSSSGTKKLYKTIDLGRLPNYLRILLIEQGQEIPLAAPMANIKIPAWIMKADDAVDQLGAEIIELVKDLLDELKAKGIEFEIIEHSGKNFLFGVLSKDVGDNLPDSYYPALKVSHDSTRNTERSELIAKNTGRLLATLHNHGIIADDTHCYQFVVDKKADVRRVDLPNAYLFSSEIANLLMRDRDQGGYGFSKAQLANMNIYPKGIPVESVLAEINGLLMQPNILLHPLFVIPFAEAYLEHAHNIDPKVKSYLEEALIKNSKAALEKRKGEKTGQISREAPPSGADSKSSSAGITADEKYILDSGYNVIGGVRDKELGKRFTYLTGINALAHDPSVYSPLRDMGRHEEISIEFASAAADQIKEAAARLKSRGKDKIRILVIGSATGIDALTAFHHAKFVNKIKSVEVGAIDIQEEGVSSTRFNFMLRLPGSRFEGEALQFAKEGFENDNIIVRRVIEGEELDGLEGKYDLILFHAPDAVGPGRADDTRVHMDQIVFKAILENARERLSDDGVVLVKNQRSILNADPNHGRYGRLIPAGFDVSFAEPEEMSLGAILAPPMPTSWAIFKLTLSPHRLPKSGSLKPSVEIKRSADREKAISQSA